MRKQLFRSYRSTSLISTWVKISVLACERTKPKPDTRVARAEAEQRRAEAVATEQVMKAKVAENRANSSLAESEIPRAMADAFLQGRMQGIS